MLFSSTNFGPGAIRGFCKKNVCSVNANKATITISPIKINGTGNIFSTIHIDSKYKLINIIVQYIGSDEGKYRITSILRVNDIDYLVFLSATLDTNSYINAYAVLMEA